VESRGSSGEAPRVTIDGTAVPDLEPSAPAVPSAHNLATLPSSWDLFAMRSLCSVGGNDACQVLSSLDARSQDRFEGWVKLEGTSLVHLKKARICVTGTPAPQPAPAPLMRIHLYAVIPGNPGT
jgi:hypothetical protein